MVVIKVGRPSPLWAAPFPRQERPKLPKSGGIELSTSKQASERACMRFSLLLTGDKKWLSSCFGFLIVTDRNLELLSK